MSSEEIKGPDERFVCYPYKGKPTFHKTVEQARLAAEQSLRDGGATAIVYELVKVAEAKAIRIEWTDV